MLRSVCRGISAQIEPGTTERIVRRLDAIATGYYTECKGPHVYHASVEKEPGKKWAVIHIVCMCSDPNGPGRHAVSAQLICKGVAETLFPFRNLYGQVPAQDVAVATTVPDHPSEAVKRPAVIGSHRRRLKLPLHEGPYPLCKDDKNVRGYRIVDGKRVEIVGPQPILREVLDRWETPATQLGRKYPELLSARALETAAWLINTHQKNPLNLSLFKIVEEVYTGYEVECSHHPKITAHYTPPLSNSAAKLHITAEYNIEPPEKKYVPGTIERVPREVRQQTMAHPKKITLDARHDIRPIADAILVLLTSGVGDAKVDEKTLNKWVMDEARVDDARIQAAREPIDLSGDVEPMVV